MERPAAPQIIRKRVGENGVDLGILGQMGLTAHLAADDPAASTEALGGDGGPLRLLRGVEWPEKRTTHHEEWFMTASLLLPKDKTRLLS